jgi:hypothetical protein
VGDCELATGANPPRAVAARSGAVRVLMPHRV